jgi:hypothetical protein
VASVFENRGRDKARRPTSVRRMNCHPEPRRNAALKGVRPGFQTARNLAIAIRGFVFG